MPVKKKTVIQCACIITGESFCEAKKGNTYGNTNSQLVIRGLLEVEASVDLECHGHVALYGGRVETTGLSVLLGRIPGLDEVGHLGIGDRREGL